MKNYICKIGVQSLFWEDHNPSLEFAEGTNFSSSDFVEVCIKQVKKLCLVGIDQVFCCDQCFLDFGEGFCEYSISRFKTQFNL